MIAMIRVVALLVFGALTMLGAGEEWTWLYPDYVDRSTVFAIGILAWLLTLTIQRDP